MSPLLTGYLGATGCAAAAAVAVVINKLAIAEVPKEIFLLYMFAAASLVGAPALPGAARAVRQLSPKFWWTNVFLHNLSICSAWLFLLEGLTELHPTVTSFIGRTEFIFVIGLAMIFFGERLVLGQTIGALMAITGIAIMRFGSISWMDLSADRPLLMMLMSALSFAVSELFAKRLIVHISPLHFTSMRNLGLTLIFGLFALARVGHIEITQYGLLLALASGAVGPFLARTLFMTAIRHLPISHCMVLTQTEPLFAAAVALLVIGSVPSEREFVGGLVVVSGCLLAQLSLYRARDRTSREPAIPVLQQKS